MRNIFISELLSGTDLPALPAGSSLADLIRTARGREKTDLYYLLDEQGRLEGLIPLKGILDYLSAHYFLTDRERMDALAASLEQTPLSSLAERDFPAVTLQHCLPEVLEQLMLSGLPALPVLDRQGKPVGEVAREALLQILPVASKETAHAFS